MAGRVTPEAAIGGQDLTAYERFLQTSPQASVFVQPWYLDAAAPGQWELLTVERGDNVFAALPIYKNRRFGQMVLDMPPITRRLGILLRPGQGHICNQLAEQERMVRELLAQIPKCAQFNQKFHYNFTYGLPLLWAGFQETVSYTHVHEDLTDLEQIWAGFASKVRNHIRKAERIVEVVDESELNFETFVEISRMTFARQGLSIPYSVEDFRRVDQACAEHNARKIFFARDTEGRVHAALYLVWDQHSAHYLTGGGDPRLRDSHAISLLIWEAIKYSATVCRSFNIEGAHGPNRSRFFREFSGSLKPYSTFRRVYSRPMRLLAGAKASIQLFRSGSLLSTDP